MNTISMHEEKFYQLHTETMTAVGFITFKVLFENMEF